MLLENNSYPYDVRVRQEALSLTAAGHTVEVVAPGGPREPRREVVDGVTVRRFRTIRADSGGVKLVLEYLTSFVALHWAALRALRRGATVLHLHNPPDFLFPAGALFRLAGRPVVFDHHDLAPELVAVRYGWTPLTALARLAERLTFAVSTHVLAANASHAEIAVGRGGKRAEEVTVVRNGPRRSWTELPMRVRQGRLREVRLVYVGAMAAQDGVDELAAVLAHLRQREPPLEVALVAVGDGSGRATLELESRRLGVADAVEVTGWVTPERVAEIIADADVCVDPAPSTPLNERSTMIKVAEYLALGKPVVGYDLLETRRTAGDAAVLVPAGDTKAFAEAIAALAENPDLRTELAERARARSLELVWERSERALLEAYLRLRRGRRWLSAAREAPADEPTDALETEAVGR